MRYTASLDTLATIITGSVILLFFFIATKFLHYMLVENFEIIDYVMLTGVIVLLLAILGGCFLFAPLAYSIHNNTFFIHRRIGKISIPIEKIKNVSILAKNELKGTIRTFGVGGLFGYFGKFYHKNQGNLTYYATKRENIILLVTDDLSKIIITPDDLSLAEVISEKIGTNYVLNDLK